MRGARGEIGLVGKRQLILSMGLVWVEVRILTQRASISSKIPHVVNAAYVL